MKRHVTGKIFGTIFLKAIRDSSFPIFFDGVQSTEDYPSISRKEAFNHLVKLTLQPVRISNWLLIGLNTNASL